MMWLLLSIVVFDRATAAEPSAHFQVSPWLTCRTPWTCFCDFVSPQKIFNFPRGSKTMNVTQKWSKKKSIIWHWRNLSTLDTQTFLWLQIPSLFKLLSYWFDGCQKVLSPLKVFSHQAAADVFSTYRGTVWLNPPFAKPTEAHKQFDFPSTQLYCCSFSVSQDV